MAKEDALCSCYFQSGLCAKHSKAIGPKPLEEENESLEILAEGWNGRTPTVCRGHILNDMSDNLFDVY